VAVTTRPNSHGRGFSRDHSPGGEYGSSTAHRLRCGGRWRAVRCAQLSAGLALAILQSVAVRQPPVCGDLCPSRGAVLQRRVVGPQRVRCSAAPPLHRVSSTPHPAAHATVRERAFVCGLVPQCRVSAGEPDVQLALCSAEEYFQIDHSFLSARAQLNASLSPATVLTALRLAYDRGDAALKAACFRLLMTNAAAFADARITPLHAAHTLGHSSTELVTAFHNDDPIGMAGSAAPAPVARADAVLMDQLLSAQESAPLAASVECKSSSSLGAAAGERCAVSTLPSAILSDLLQVRCGLLRSIGPAPEAAVDLPAPPSAGGYAVGDAVDLWCVHNRAWYSGQIASLHVQEVRVHGRRPMANVTARVRFTYWSPKFDRFLTL
jgi:hypothetical protein